MTILFTKHAQDKFNVLKRHQFTISETQVLETVRNPELIDRSRSPLLIAQRGITNRHVLRVVYKHQDQSTIRIITFYPGRKTDYE